MCFELHTCKRVKLRPTDSLQTTVATLPDQDFPYTHGHSGYICYCDICIKEVVTWQEYSHCDCVALSFCAYSVNLVQFVEYKRQVENAEV